MKVKEKGLRIEEEENLQQMLCPKGYKYLMNMTQMTKSEDEAFSAKILSEREANEARIFNSDEANQQELFSLSFKAFHGHDTQ